MKKVAVLFGGNSSEKEVSLHTGLAVVEAIKNQYDVEGINVGSDYTSLHKKLLDTDVVFVALHGGYGEDGRLQKYFEKHNIKYTGSNSKASHIAMDKNRTKLIAKENGIPILNWLILEDENDVNAIAIFSELAAKQEKIKELDNELKLSIDKIIKLLG